MAAVADDSDSLVTEAAGLRSADGCDITDVAGLVHDELNDDCTLELVVEGIFGIAEIPIEKA